MRELSASGVRATSEFSSRTKSPLDASVSLVDRGCVSEVAFVADERDVPVWRLRASAGAVDRAVVDDDHLARTASPTSFGSEARHSSTTLAGVPVDDQDRDERAAHPATPRVDGTGLPASAASPNGGPVETDQHSKRGAGRSAPPGCATDHVPARAPESRGRVPSAAP